MSKVPYEAIGRMIEPADTPGLPVTDRYLMNRVKNWLRERDYSGNISAHKVNLLGSADLIDDGRGIAI